MNLPTWWKSKKVRMINWWPPLFFAGIKVTRFAEDLRQIDVRLSMHCWNRNYVGTHFGGSLYAMTDPFYMLMLMQNLGSEYIVWDKAASIRFKRPGTGTVTAKFAITAADLDQIRAATASGEKFEPVYTVLVKNDAGTVIAEVEKTLYIKRKDTAA